MINDLNFNLLLFLDKMPAQVKFKDSMLLLYIVHTNVVVEFL